MCEEDVHEKIEIRKKKTEKKRKRNDRKEDRKEKKRREQKRRESKILFMRINRITDTRTNGRTEGQIDTNHSLI